MSTATKQIKERAVKVSLKGITTAEEALEKAGLAWIAQEDDMMTMGGIECPTHKGIIRSDTKTFIGVMGKDYHPIQNSTAFGFFDAILQKHNASYDSAFILEGGSQIMLRATINGEIEIRKGDGVIQQIDLVNSFNGTRKLVAYFNVWRIMCSNGLMGLKKENKIEVRHTKNSENKLQEALKVFGKSQVLFKNFIETSRVLAQKTLTKKMVQDFLKQVEGEAKSTKKQNIHDKINELFENGRGTGKGTAWDMYNAYTEWIDHHRGTDNLRLYNSVIGSSHMKEKAFDVAISL